MANELREYLLPLTISHAYEQSLFYQKKFEKFNGEVTRLKDLENLPVLYKSDLTDSLDEIRTFHEFPDFLMYTSGTTGKALEVPVYQKEIEAYNELVLSTWREKLGNELPLTLAVLRVGHGSHVLTRQIPTLPCHINYGLDQLISLLEGDHWVDGKRVKVSNLEANVLNFRYITKELLLRGISPKKFGLETISVSGWYVPAYERDFWQEAWGAILLDRYGVTEVHGDAKWCHSCEFYHFDFTVIPEVLDPETNKVITNGIGHMLITGLFPFNQAVPKIRYFTGDFVEIRSTDCSSSEFGVRFLSRIGDAVKVPGEKDLARSIFSTDVVEALAPLPDVARKDNTGFLKFKLSSSPDQEVSIEIELNYHPALFPGRVEELRKLIVDALRQRRDYPGEMQLHFVQPEHLQDITKV